MEKSFFDAHFHIVPLGLHLCNRQMDDFEFAEKNIPELKTRLENHFLPYTKDSEFSGISCALDAKEFFVQKELVKHLNSNPSINLKTSFGIHPANPNKEKFPFLEKLLENNEIYAIGECGFDLYTKELKKTLDIQKKIFLMQLDSAVKYHKPLVLHLRKSIDMIFQILKKDDKLKKVPQIIFHSWSFPPQMAESLVKNGVNAYFSFGKNIELKSKNALACIKDLPEKIGKERIIFETDAPYGLLTFC